MAAARSALVLLVSVGVGAGCVTTSKIFARNFTAFFHSPAPVPDKIEQPVRADARLAVLWIGHATALIQMDDKLILTDPVFTRTVGQFSPRLVEPGLDAEDLPQVDLVLISHMHIDHLSVASLDQIEPRVERMLVPRTGLVYVPNYAFPTDEVATWQTVNVDGLRVTAVPVNHSGFRYGADRAWRDEGFTGYVIEYNGLTVYFGGDTAYHPTMFRQTARRFPSIDVALLPIGPVEPAAYARDNHIDPAQAVRVFREVGARFLVPVHYDTFPHGLDRPGDAVALLKAEVDRTGLEPERLHVLPIGGQRVFYRRQPLANAAR